MSIIGAFVLFFFVFAPILNNLFGDGHDRCGVWGHNEGCDCPSQERPPPGGWCTCGELPGPCQRHGPRRPRPQTHDGEVDIDVSDL